MAISRRVYLVLVALVVRVLLALGGVATAATSTQILKQPPFPPTDVDFSSLVSTLAAHPWCQQPRTRAARRL
jgi:hypothetical protein